jgi:hypothetical protein
MALGARHSLTALSHLIAQDGSGGGAAEQGEWMQLGDELNALDRRRTSSIDSKARTRTSMSPRPVPYLRGGVGEHRERAATHTGHRHTRHTPTTTGGTAAAESASAQRSRSWTTSGSAGISDPGWEPSRDRSNSNPFGGGVAPTEPPRLPPLGPRPSWGDDHSVSSSDTGGGDGSGDRLVPGRIELYASPTANADLDALFDVLEPGSLASQQIPLRNRALP